MHGLAGNFWIRDRGLPARIDDGGRLCHQVQLVASGSWSCQMSEASFDAVYELSIQSCKGRWYSHTLSHQRVKRIQEGAGMAAKRILGILCA